MLKMDLNNWKILWSGLGCEENNENEITLEQLMDIVKDPEKYIEDFLHADQYCIDIIKMDSQKKEMHIQITPIYYEIL